MFFPIIRSEALKELYFPFPTKRQFHSGSVSSLIRPVETLLQCCFHCFVVLFSLRMVQFASVCLLHCWISREFWEFYSSVCCYTYSAHFSSLLMSLVALSF